jgi:uncharacterized protein YciI
MLFAIINLDKPASLDLRMATREAHLAYVGAAGAAVRIAGPLFADDGTTMAGSLLVLEFSSLQEAREWAANDPYAKAGLFASSTVRPWKWTMADGAPIKG